ncbi:MAG: hypothetical protein ACYC0V_05220 [Armatimonadota bacterium]
MNYTGYAFGCVIVGMTIAVISPVMAVKDSDDRFIPVKELTICGRALPSDAETLAAERFSAEYTRFTGVKPSIVWGDRLMKGGVSIVIGNKATLSSLFSERKWDELVSSQDKDIRNQSYLIDAVKKRGSSSSITVAGYGDTDTPRGSLGISYGLAELLRRLDIRDGKWGFVLPVKSVVGTPATPHRTLYTGKFVDNMIDAGYDRIILGQGFPTSMYYKDNDAEYAGVMREHQEDRQIISLARRRGIEVCQYILPPYVRPEILEHYLDLQGEGFYNQKPGHGGLCWSKPKARDMITNFTREKMEYYGPVDSYAVWFYDPGGCFCPECKANQATNIFEQLMLVKGLAKTISPSARVEAVLWPTWCFHEYQQRGIPFTAEEVQTFVKDFLTKCKAEFAPGELTILDTCESDVSNIYNGLVDSKLFKRNGFMYSAMGMPGELAYRFPPMKFKYLTDQMNLARSRGVDDTTLYLAGWLTPTVYAFPEILYTGKTDWHDVVRSCARISAKGDAYQPYVDLLTILEETAWRTDYKEIDSSLSKAESMWQKVDSSPHFFGDRDWLKGYMIAQRSYLEMARAIDEETFTKWFTGYKQQLSQILEFQGYTAALSPALVVNAHLSNYWRGPAGDKNVVGLGAPGALPNTGKVDARTGDKVAP